MEKLTFFSPAEKAPAKLLFFAAVVLLCGLSGLFIKRTRDLNQAEKWVTQSHVVRLNLAETLSKLKEAEADQRGFLLSQDASFLQQYNSSKRRFYSHLDHLRALVGDNPGQVANVDSLRRLVSRRLQLLEGMLARHQDGLISPGEPYRGFLLGKEVMEAIKVQLGRMDALEARLLDDRTALSSRYKASLPLYAGLLSALALALLGFVFYRLMQQLRLSKKYLSHSRQAEEEARRNYLLLERAEKLGTIGSWKWNTVSNKVDWSKNLLTLAGLEAPPGQPSLAPFLELVHPGDRGRVAALLQEQREADAVFSTRFRLVRPDGALRHLKSNGRLIRNEEGQPILLATVQDVTEEYLLEQKARQRANFMELMLQNNVDMIAAYDTELRVTHWNRACEKMYGFTQEDVLGKKITDLLPGLLDDEKLHLMEAALQGKETLCKEISFFHNRRTAEIWFIPLKNGEDEVEGLLVLVHDITQIKEAMGQLKENNIRFEQAEQAGRLGSFRWDTQSDAFSFSQNLYRIFGVEPGSVSPCADWFHRQVHPDDRETFLDYRRQTREGGDVSPLHLRILRPDGSVRYIRGFQTFGEKEVVFGSIQDCTEEELLKQDLQRRNELIETLLDNSTDTIFAVDGEQRITTWNKPCAERLGLEKADVLGKKLPDLLPSMLKDGCIGLVEAGLNGTATLKHECAGAGGRVEEFNFIPLKDSREQVKGLLVMGHDITERIQAAKKLEKANMDLHLRNKALQEAYAFNRHISELAPISIYVFDLMRGSHVFANKSLLDTHGFSEKELQEMGPGIMQHLLHPDDIAREQENHERLKTAVDGTVLETEFRLRNREGHYRHLYARQAIFRRNAKGEPEQIIGMALDITALKAAEKELKEKNIELQQTNEELASFNFIASHDLQEPLRKIQTFSNMLEASEPALSEEGRSKIQKILTAAARMRALIHDLLSYSKVDMAREEQAPVDLNEVLEQAQFSLKASLDEKGATVVADRLPRVRGVEFQMRQLFENIIGNAVKYSRPEAPPVVTISAREVPARLAGTGSLRLGDSCLHLQFCDNGIGFEQEYAGKIFELFQRLHNRSEYPGTGLGLAICKKIVQNHGGYIEATGKPGEGAVFDVFLPVG
ncbi:PAS domain S-box protein [Paraflavisolibacter sp. H34]|uniref:PAS domain S-box protein n=1 Tax=Huijunlia imazamoxiresistens TaxID=3127457 RepID=UPI00301A6B57